MIQLSTRDYIDMIVMNGNFLSVSDVRRHDNIDVCTGEEKKIITGITLIQMEISYQFPMFDAVKASMFVQERKRKEIAVRWKFQFLMFDLMGEETKKITVFISNSQNESW